MSDTEGLSAREPVTVAGRRYVNGSLRDMIERYGPGWSLRTVIADIEHEAATLPESTVPLASTLLDAVEEAINSNSLPANVHRRLRRAFNAVVEEANR